MTQFLADSRRINDSQAAHFLARAEAAGLKAGDKVAILGAAYRGDIDDARDTPTELLIEALGKAGYSYETHDPHVTRMVTHCGYPANLTHDLGSALEGASAAFIMTDHTAYKSLKPEQFGAMKTKLMIDTRRMIDSEQFSQNGYQMVIVGVSN